MYVVDKKKNWGFVSIIISALAMFFCLIPAVGYLLSMIGMFLGYTSLLAYKKDVSILGIVLGSIALMLTILRTGLVYFYG